MSDRGMPMLIMFHQVVTPPAIGSEFFIGKFHPYWSGHAPDGYMAHHQEPKTATYGNKEKGIAGKNDVVCV